MQVNITYPASKRSKSLNIRTPSRKAGIKGIARRSYKTLASTIAKSPIMLASMLKEVCGAIKVEMKQLSSDKHDSVLRDNIEAVKHFHWDTVMLEMEKMIPTLISILKHLVPSPSQNKPLVALIASQLLKARHQRMGLVQRAVSVMLYGNGSSKQVGD